MNRIKFHWGSVVQGKWRMYGLSGGRVGGTWFIGFSREAAAEKGDSNV